MLQLTLFSSIQYIQQFESLCHHTLSCEPKELFVNNHNFSWPSLHRNFKFSAVCCAESILCHYKWHFKIRRNPPVALIQYERFYNWTFHCIALYSPVSFNRKSRIIEHGFILWLYGALWWNGLHEFMQNHVKTVHLSTQYSVRNGPSFSAYVTA